MVNKCVTYVTPRSFYCYICNIEGKQTKARLTTTMTTQTQKATHTQGEWKVLAGTIIQEKSTGKTLAIAPEGRGKLGFEETRANAQLISAAPDMLKVLKSADIIFRWDDSVGTLTEPKQTLWNEIKQAIAKVEGKK